MHYAGFWRRFGAFWIDVILLSAVDSLLDLLIYGSPYICQSGIQHVYQNGEWHQNPITKCGVGGWWSFFTYWLYFTLAESSKWQATVGKYVFKLKVTDLNGNRIGFGRANGRYWSQILSMLLLGIGYIMVAFTQKKQGLHDLIAKTLVVKE